MNHSRSGFLLLMLVAFTSIILGLSVTFYLYCTRNLDDSRMAVQLANQRLALRAAINYLANPPGNARSDKYSSAVEKDLQGASGRSKRLGWYRIKQAGIANSVYVTAGCGPSDGVQKPTTGNPADWNDAHWAFELRSWYLIELNPPPVTSADAIVKIEQINSPASGVW